MSRDERLDTFEREIRELRATLELAVTIAERLRIVADDLREEAITSKIASGMTRSEAEEVVEMVVARARRDSEGERGARG